MPHYFHSFQGISFPPYGSVAYLDQLRDRTVTWEFLIVKGDVGIECSMDVDYFPKEPSSAAYLQSSKSEVSRM